MSNAMQMLNLTLVGRVVADPITQEVNGKEVTRFRVIHNQEFNGENTTIIFNCSAWNGLNKIAQYLKKGRLVCVTSNDFTQKIWNKDGKSGINNYLTLNSITILDKKPNNNQVTNESLNQNQNTIEYTDEE